MTASSLQDQIAALEALERDALVVRWELAFGCVAPQRCRAPFLIHALVWHLQASARQAPRKFTIQQLLRQARVRPTTAPTLPVGSRLAREWQGRTHMVTVTSKGFDYNGSAYRSLSAIARAITGTPWSGPLFFGLKS